MKSLFKKTVCSINPSWYNKRICSIDGLWNYYFIQAEGSMAKQWDEIIWPKIKNFDFASVLELAPGAGRNTEQLAKISKIIHAVDLNEYALEQLRKRFAKYRGGCEIHVHKNEGKSLEMIINESISTIYCWDAAVHFEKSIMRNYINEFSRVLKPGGQGFVHHSNLGTKAHYDIMKSPHGRTNMSQELFREYCEDNNLTVVEQFDLPWEEIVDCISIFRKPAA